MSHIKLSVLIPTYNYKKGLKRILNSFLDIPINILKNIEIIVGDDSNTPILDQNESNFYRKSLPNFIFLINKEKKV